jgi:hypothetical protein
MFLDKLKTPQTNNGTRQNNRNIWYTSDRSKHR